MIAARPPLAVAQPECGSHVADRSFSSGAAVGVCWIRVSTGCRLGDKAAAPVRLREPNDVYVLVLWRCMLLDVGRSAVRRTNINLDSELVDAAATILGTTRTTDTVHAALRDVVARAGRERLAQRDYSDLTPDALEELRRPRTRA